jgi:hypothetical protein
VTFISPREPGINADAVNQARFGELFGTIQDASLGEMILSVAKLFERASDRYPVRSIPAAIAVLKSGGSDLQPIEPLAALPDFDRAGIDTTGLRNVARADFSERLAALLDASCPDTNRAEACMLSRTLDALRASRDKTIAHNEAIDRELLPKAKWVEAETLLAYAQNVSAGLAMAYFSSAWTDDDGRFSMGYDAQVAASQLQRLLKAAGIAPGLPSSNR